MSLRETRAWDRLLWSLVLLAVVGGLSLAAAGVWILVRLVEVLG